MMAAQLYQKTLISDEALLVKGESKQMVIFTLSIR